MIQAGLVEAPAGPATRARARPGGGRPPRMRWRPAGAVAPPPRSSAAPGDEFSVVFTIPSIFYWFFWLSLPVLGDRALGRRGLRLALTEDFSPIRLPAGSAAGSHKARAEVPVWRGGQDVEAERSPEGGATGISPDFCGQTSACLTRGRG